MQRGTLKCSGVTSKQGKRRRTSHLFYCCTLVSVRVCVGVVALLFYPFASWHICAPVLNKVSCKHTHTRTYKQHTHIPTYTHTQIHTYSGTWRPKFHYILLLLPFFVFFFFWSFAICAAFRVPFPPNSLWD